MTLSYLVSTAGHAQQQNDDHPHDIRSVLQLIEDGAEEFGEEKVVGFTRLDQGWTADCYSFPELLRLSNGCIHQLADDLNIARSPAIVALLCPTNVDFLVTWVALMRMGYGVLLVAPQCSPSAIQNLLNSTGAERLVYHPKYKQLARTACSLSNTPLVELIANDALQEPPAGLPPAPEISHIFHSSGTSGNPKPIPHTHVGSVRILPRRALPSYLGGSPGPPPESAAFTTTPLFHGGISDLLRAWMARSMIYFYPTSDVPITTRNVIGAVGACRPPPPLRSLSPAQEEERRHRFTPTAFLSVPYILTVLAREVDGTGLKMMRDMQLVSTGGAPLDKVIGDTMVKHGVALVSRLGSSECGFLMSSWRDFESDKEWDWLHNDSTYSDALVFEPVEGDPNGLSEMVVTSRWASNTKTNRPEGSYATADLYRPHPSKPNVWQYAGRADDVIVMSNGEKTSPASIEAQLRADPQIRDVLVVGNDQAQIGALIFASETPDGLDATLRRINMDQPSFAALSPEMCTVITDPQRAASIPKSSKGTVQRGLAYQVFQEDIKALYERQSCSDAPRRSVQDIESLVTDLVQGARSGGTCLKPTTDLFSWGIDSLMATRIRAELQRQMNLGGSMLPMNVVFERSTVQSLARYLYQLQEGISTEAEDMAESMRQLVDEFGTFSGATSQSGRMDTLILTGSTGSLGLELLRELEHTSWRKIICLVRPSSLDAARRRVGKLQETKTCEILAVDLAASRLGLDLETYERLSEADSILHAAWPVHFASGLASFRDSFAGVHNLLELAGRSPHCSFYYCSSLASVLASGEVVTEVPSNDPATASPLGYSRSKWVAEAICHSARQSGMGDRVRILRIGQLCASSRGGVWNEREGWPLLIRSAETTGCLPLLDETVSWLPVDLAARATLEIIASKDSSSTYHVAQPHTTTWNTVLDGLESAGLVFERVTTAEWLKRVRDSPEDAATNPSRKMLFLWESSYGEPHATLTVDTSRARAASATLAGTAALDRDDVARMVGAWRNSGFLK